MATEGESGHRKRLRGSWVFAGILLLSCALGELVQYGVIHISSAVVAVLRLLLMVLVFAGATFTLIRLVREWCKLERLTPGRWTKWILFVGALGILTPFFGMPILYFLGQLNDA